MPSRSRNEVIEPIPGNVLGTMQGMEAAAAPMINPRTGADPHVVQAMLETMVGRGLEAAIPLLERAHGMLSGGEGVRLFDGSLARAVECPEGPHGGVWRKAILVDDGRLPTLTVLQVGGEPDPLIDGLVDRRIGRDPSTRPPPQATPCMAAKVYLPSKGWRTIWTTKSRMERSVHAVAVGATDDDP